MYILFYFLFQSKKPRESEAMEVFKAELSGPTLSLCPLLSDWDGEFREDIHKISTDKVLFLVLFQSP